MRRPTAAASARVAAALLYASPPADRLARGLAQRIPGSEVTEGFVFTAPTDSAGPDALRYSDAGRPLFVARAHRPIGGRSTRTDARARARTRRSGAARRARGPPRRGLAARSGRTGDDRRGARRASMHRRRAAERVFHSLTPVRRIRVLPQRGTRVHVERGRADADVRDAAPRRASRRAAGAARSAPARRGGDRGPWRRARTLSRAHPVARDRTAGRRSRNGALADLERAVVSRRDDAPRARGVGWPRGD